MRILKQFELLRYLLCVGTLSLLLAGCGTNPGMTVAGSLPNAVVGQPYSAQITAIGGTAPYQFTCSVLPRGLQMDSEGRITGTPSQSGVFTITITVQDSRP
jgi:hypothetical protein